MDAEEAKRKILEGKNSQAVRRKLIDRTQESAKLKKQGDAALAQEVVQTVEMPHPIYIDSAQGGHMTDLDGNVYLDMTMGFGPIVLGHRPASVVKALEEQVKNGWHFGIPNRKQTELAEVVREASPCSDHVVFCNSGTEATMYAMRLARAFTGKPKVALFDGSYHGVHDYALIRADRRSPRDAPAGRDQGAGLPAVIREQTVIMLPYRNDAAFDLVRAHKDELALVLIEPSQSSNPRLDCGKFLADLLEVCRESDVLLLFDEVITGFRIAYGGCQEHYGIAPDLATYGKAIGGGLAVGAVGGRSDVMNWFSGRGGAGRIFSGGTFSGNPLTMAAGLAAVGELRERKDEVYPYLTEQGNRLTAQINAFCTEHDFAAQLMNAGSSFHLQFQREPIEGSRDISNASFFAEREFYLHLLGHGVMIPGIHLAFLCAAHTPADVDTIRDAMAQSFMDLREDGLL